MDLCRQLFGLGWGEREHVVAEVLGIAPLGRQRGGRVDGCRHRVGPDPAERLQIGDAETVIARQHRIVRHNRVDVCRLPPALTAAAPGRRLDDEAVLGELAQVIAGRAGVLVQPPGERGGRGKPLRPQDRQHPHPQRVCDTPQVTSGQLHLGQLLRRFHEAQGR